MGYCGGQKQHPTYHDLGDNSETVEMDYDPAQIKYEQLVTIFFHSHSCASSFSRQYRSAIFYHTEDQRRVAETCRQREIAQGHRVATEIEPMAQTRFWLAEDYHQKYSLQQVPALMHDFEAMYPSMEAFVNSTAAARVNGYVGGGGRKADLERDLPALGLSLQGRDALLASAPRQ